MMTAPGNDLLIIILTLSVLLSSGYAMGRVHQSRKHGLERDEAYRAGYDKASRSIMGMMSDRRPPGGTTTATHAVRKGRHARGRSALAQQRRHPRQSERVDRAGA